MSGFVKDFRLSVFRAVADDSGVAGERPGAQAGLHMAVAVAHMNDADYKLGSTRVEEVISRLADVAEFADRHEDIDLVIKTLDLQAGIIGHLFAQRGPETARLIALARARHQPRQRNYRYTPPRIMFGLIEAQFAFMLAHLVGDRPGVERAIDAVRACESNAISKGEIDLAKQTREVLVDMREMLERMSACSSAFKPASGTDRTDNDVRFGFNRCQKAVRRFSPNGSHLARPTNDGLGRRQPSRLAQYGDRISEFDR